MLESTPMPSTDDSAGARLCQRDDPSPVWTRTGMVDPRPIIAAVVRAYTALDDLAEDVTLTAILGPGRTPTVAQARHLCAYLLAEDYHLTNRATAQALGRTDHTTALHSRARVAAALSQAQAQDQDQDQNTLLARVLDRARADLAGHPHTDDDDERERRAEGRRRALAAASSRDLAEYRYWRLRALRSPHTGATGGA